MNGWMQIGDDKKISVDIYIDEYHEEFDHERQEKIKVADKVSFKPAEYEWSIKPLNDDHTCKKCKNLISIFQEVNGEIMHCGYNCKKSSMREDDIKETRRCRLYARIDTDQ